VTRELTKSLSRQAQLLSSKLVTVANQMKESEKNDTLPSFPRLGK